MYANFVCYAFISTVISSVWSQGPVQLLFSSNSVYSGEPVTLTVTYASGFMFAHLTIEALSDKLPTDFLSCSASTGKCIGTGIFAGKSPNGWPTIPLGASNVSMSLTATPSHERDYNGTLRVGDGSNYYSETFGPSFLQVRVCPTTPSFQPSPVAFYDSDNGVVVCESHNGKPAANVSLTVRDSRGNSSSRNGNDSAVIELSSPLSNWYNSTATCLVTNHNCSNMIVMTGVFIRFNTTVPNEVCTNESKFLLNCSTHIWSDPGFVYKWTVPAEANITESLDRESLTVPQGQSGSFNCTATNAYSMASVVIAFRASNVCHPMMTTPIITTGVPSCELCWIIGLVLGVIVVIVIAVVLGVLCKRGHFSKRKNIPGVVPSGSNERSDNDSNRVRLLIAAEGLVSQLSGRTLRTTAVVEYSDRSCSLNNILEKVEQMVPRSSSKFKSVALLLRPAKMGVTLSEVDQAELNSSSIQKEKGEKVRAFIIRLVKICLDEHGGTRMDILNYSGKAPVRLSEGLNNLLGIPTTVSRDYFGVDTPTGDNGGHAFVADDYFDRSNLNEIVYAELQQPSVKPQAQPRPSEDRVIYSEIKR